ncbi:MAG: omptin family outer membrane protease [Desulfomonilaceae bacterium]
MVVRGVVAVFVALALWCFSTLQCHAEGLPGLIGCWNASSAVDVVTGSPRLCQSMGIKKFINSFTSYQFVNPFPPFQDPLSRLEFPIDQWFLGLTTKYEARSWSVHAEGWVNVNRESGLKMQDSDWDDDANPSQKTIFSESPCRLNKGLLFDTYMAVSIPWQRFSNVRPLLGYRYQQFSFTTHDGAQAVLGSDVTDLPGDGIDFQQVFNHLYFGGVLNASLDLGDILSNFPRVDLECQLDYALVNARNEDLHLLRKGERVTAESTLGHCWHFLMSMGFFRRGALSARVEADFKRSLTNGDHQLRNNLFNLNFSFDGSRVWSDQVSISALGQLVF